jgi:hypothetical protein
MYAPEWFTGDSSRPAQLRAARDSSDLAPGPPEPFVIHIGSYRLLTDADAEMGNLRTLGVNARYLRLPVPGRGVWYRVVAGRFRTFAAAESAAHALQSEGKIRNAHIVGGNGWGEPVPVAMPDK